MKIKKVEVGKKPAKKTAKETAKTAAKGARDWGPNGNKVGWTNTMIEKAIVIDENTVQVIWKNQDMYDKVLSNL